jgi:hypothetical protein
MLTSHTGSHKRVQMGQVCYDEILESNKLHLYFAINVINNKLNGRLEINQNISILMFDKRPEAQQVAGPGVAAETRFIVDL